MHFTLHCNGDIVGWSAAGAENHAGSNVNARTNPPLAYASLFWREDPASAISRRTETWKALQKWCGVVVGGGDAVVSQIPHRREVIWLAWSVGRSRVEMMRVT